MVDLSPSKGHTAFLDFSLAVMGMVSFPRFQGTIDKDFHTDTGVPLNHTHLQYRAFIGKSQMFVLKSGDILIVNSQK